MNTTREERDAIRADYTDHWKPETGVSDQLLRLANDVDALRGLLLEARVIVEGEFHTDGYEKHDLLKRIDEQLARKE